MVGRPMTGWIVITENGFANAVDLANWVPKGAEYANS